MKPTLEQKNISGKTREATSVLPLVDCNYHVVAMPQFRGGCARRELPSFRNISREYFRNEARGEFQREVVAFAAIVVTAAIPILSNMHALADFLRVIGGL